MPRVFVSRLIPAPVAEVWQVIRDFDTLPNWAPFVRDCVIEGAGPPDRPGSVRALELADGTRLREELVALSDYDFSLSYVILDSPLPLEGYLATLSLVPVTERDQTLACWEAEFDCHPDDAPGLSERIRDQVFAAGLAGLARVFGPG